MLISSGICDAVSVFTIVDRSVCEKTIASFMATGAARTKVVSMCTLITVEIAFLVSRWKR